MKILRSSAVALFILGQTVLSQTNITFRSSQDIHGNGYANIWGYRDSVGNEYALVGCNTGTSVVKVTNPTSPVEIDFIPGPTSTWHEIQVWGKYAYVVSEHTNGPYPGLQIIDLSRLPDTAFLANRYTATFTRAHDLQIRDGFAYITGATNSLTTPNGGIHILDLSNPTSPVEVGVWDSLYVHDCYVNRDTIYAACIYQGVVAIIDVKDKAHPRVIHTFTYPNGFTHNTAITDDSRYLFTTDETQSPVGRLRMWDMITLKDDVEGNTNIEQTASFGSTAIVHNVFSLGNFAYASYYTEGVRVWNVTNPDTLPVVGHYDTYPNNNSANFDGAWGVYPFLPSGNLIVSDMTYGLFVLSFDLAQKGYIRGVVLDSVTQSPVQGAKVTFIETNLSAWTDVNGAFALPALAGRYTLRLDRSNYVREYYATEVTTNDTTDVAVELVPTYIVDVAGGQFRPASFELHQNFPNPFNPTTTISYAVEGVEAVSLKIYNTLGQEIRTLVNERSQSGTHSVTWDGRDNTGRNVSSGIYVYRLIAGQQSTSRKMLLLK